MTKPLRFGVQAIKPADPVLWPDVARKAEDLGYSILTMSDHFDSPLSPFPALAIAASATRTLRIGTIVFGNDFRHPAVVARDAATLDVLSGGRFELGLGAGWMQSDYHPPGIAFDSAGTRIDRLAESVEIITQLFSGEPANFAGEHYTVTDLAAPTLPTQRPGPPIFMGGGGPKMLRTAGRLANIVGINPNLSSGGLNAESGPDGTLDRTRQKLAWVKEAAGERWPEIEIQSRLHLATITDDAEGLADSLAPALGLTAEQALASPHSLIGTVEQIVDKIQQLREELGISYYTWNVDVIDEMAPVIAAFQ